MLPSTKDVPASSTGQKSRRSWSPECTFRALFAGRKGK